MVQRESFGDPNYRSYMVRLWRGSADGDWHATAQSTATAALHRFASIEQLCAFLRAGAGGDDEDGAAPPERADGQSI